MIGKNIFLLMSNSPISLINIFLANNLNANCGLSLFFSEKLSIIKFRRNAIGSKLFDH